MKKLLHERLREIAPRISKSGGDDWGIDELREVMNVACYSTYQSDLKNTVLAIADEIEKYYIPRPRFEDGEPVQFGDSFIQKCVNVEVELDKIGISLFTKDGLNMVWFPDEVVPRSEPKVLDADGVEIKIGDKVYLVPGKHCGTFPLLHYMPGVEYTVVENDSPSHKANGRICISRGDSVLGFPMPEQVTHREPDSLEKLRDDVLDTCEPITSVTKQEWADRLTALMERDA